MSPLRTQHLSPSSPFFAPSHPEDSSLFPSLSFFLWIFHLFTFCYVLNARLPESAWLSSVFANLTATRCDVCHIQESAIEFSKNR